MTHTYLESMGRGEACNLLLKDSGLPYEYVRLDFAKFKETKADYTAKGLVQPTLPYMEANGKVYGKAAPILRFLAKKLGKYDGKNDDDIQYVDALSDALYDWGAQWGLALFGGLPSVAGQPTPIEKYNVESFPGQVKTFDAALAKFSGPYLLGEEVWDKVLWCFHLTYSFSRLPMLTFCFIISLMTVNKRVLLLLLTTPTLLNSWRPLQTDPT